jgi:2-alkyl-3-oxoalkanoate reductase
MNILITGAAGFIGNALLSEVLKRGHKVTALVRSSVPEQWRDKADLEILRLDLRQLQPASLEGTAIDVILHLAAATAGGAEEQYENTVIGTRNLLNAARQAGIRRVVGVSSIAVLDYLSVRPMSIIDERVVVPVGKRIGAYASAKLQQESLFVGFGREGGNTCVILRPGLVYDESRLVVAHAGIIRANVCVLASHCGEVPTIEVHGLARAIADAAQHTMQGCDVMNLVDDNLPSQSEYIAGLRRRGLLPPGGIVMPWQVLRGMSGLLRAAFTVTGFSARLPEILLSEGFSARLAPFRFSNAKAKAVLRWTPGREFA